jgi:hypothetical protein
MKKYIFRVNNYMENDLVSIYENAYLQRPVIAEQTYAKKDTDDTDDDDDTTSPVATMAIQTSSTKSMKKKQSNDDKTVGGAHYADSFKRSETIFDKILREMDEMGGSMGPAMGPADTDDQVYEPGEDEQEEAYTLSELRGMTMGEIVALLSTDTDDYEEEESDEFDDSDEIEDDEFAPGDKMSGESYEGNCMGSQGTYDGKAKRQPATTHVKSNGDADFGKQHTGYDPEDTEGSEGAEHGSQGDYNGKAKRQAATSHVKSNGDAQHGMAKTAFKTSSGKKPKNYF